MHVSGNRNAKAKLQLQKKVQHKFEETADMKILYLSHRIPYPPNKGDKIRSFNEIKYLSKRHEIHLACLADDPKDLRYEEALQNYCSVTNVFRLKVSVAKIRGMASLLLGNSLSVGYFYSDGFRRKLTNLSNPMITGPSSAFRLQWPNIC